MAKSKPAVDSSIIPPDNRSPEDVTEDLAGTDADPRDAELAQLRADLAAKDEQIRQLSTPMVGVSDAINFNGPPKRFVVAVTDAATWVVEAPHESLAFDAYKRAVGMIATPHTPNVRPVADDYPLGRFSPTFPGPGEGLPK